VVGIDPSIDAIKAARRVSRQCDVIASFIVGDARHLPFRNETFDTVFSYSVLQHLSKENVRRSLISIARVLKPGGMSFVQMPNRFGIVSLYHQVRRGFKTPSDFMVRYWTPRELAREFYSHFGPVTLSVDGYFGLGIQAADAEMLPRRYRCVVHLSELIRPISQRFPVLVQLADSLYVKAVKRSEVDWPTS
jgi:ubiquinone/menaquinone biosynthesis C-methylase UbiE